MILKQTIVRKLFYSMGFLEAHKWTEDKLREMAREIPKRARPDQVPERYQEIYAQLKEAARKKEFITWKKLSK